MLNNPLTPTATTIFVAELTSKKFAVCLKDIAIRKQAFCLPNKDNNGIKISQSEIRKGKTSELPNKRIFG